MSEVHEPERDPLDPFREVVDGLSRPIRHVRAVPRRDLWRPLHDGATEPADLWGHLGIGEVAADLSDPLVSESRIGVVVDLTDHLLSHNRPSGLVVPRVPGWASGVGKTRVRRQRWVVVSKRLAVVIGW